MGNFYTNYTLRGPSQQAVAAALAGRSAMVTPEQDGCVVVFDETSDDQNQEGITGLASKLSSDLNCPVLAVLNHDDDIFWYQLYLSGELADEYDSSPGYFEPAAEPSAPAGGDARKLCTAFGTDSVAEVESILRKSSFEEGGYTFAVERHTDLARALGLPSFGVGAGFRYVSDGELPEGLEAGRMVRVGAAEAPADATATPLMDVDYRKIITIDPQVRNGEPCFRGLPITVAEVVSHLASGMSPEQVIAAHPELTMEDMFACVLFVANHYPTP